MRVANVTRSLAANWTFKSGTVALQPGIRIHFTRFFTIFLKI